MDHNQQARLHVPEPPARPGQKSRYQQHFFSKAGEAPKPAETVGASEIHDLAYALIRVLDDDDLPKGAWAPQAPPEVLRRGLRAMAKTRAYDGRMMMLQRQGQTSFYMQCVGEEAIACAFQTALRKGDMHFPTYRQQGLLIAQEWSVVDMMCQVVTPKRVLFCESDLSQFSGRCGRVAD